MRKKLILLFLLPLLSFHISPVLSKTDVEETGAENGESTDVTLTYRMEVTEKVELTVSVRGPGVLKDGEEDIRNGVNVYELKPDSEKQFIIKPDPGSKVASLKINKEEVGDKFDDNVSIKGIKEDTFVKVVFEKAKDNTNANPNGSITNSQNDSNGSSNNAKLTNGGISTGIYQPINWLFIILLIAGTVMVYTVMKKKEIDNENLSEGGNHE